MHVEQSFAHILDAGGMRRAILRGQENIEKGYRIPGFCYNISLVIARSMVSERRYSTRLGRKEHLFKIISFYIHEHYS
jgi:hypothetical protein